MDNEGYVDPIEEVYRIRQEILEEYGGIRGWNKHLDEVRPQQEAAGLKFLTDAEAEALRNRVPRHNQYKRLE